MTRLSRVESYTLSNIYGSFFNKLFIEAKMQKLVSGPMNCKALTPPWILGTANFVYGLTRNKTIPFTSCELPRKYVLLGAGKKPLLFAIIDTRIKKEEVTNAALVQILSSHNISVMPVANAQEPDSYSTVL